MSEKKLTSYQEAEEKLPTSWPEKLFNSLDTKRRFLYFGLGIAGYSYLYANYVSTDSLWTHVIAGGLYTASSLADIASTAKAFDAANYAKKFNVRERIFETSFLIRNVQSSEELFKNRMPLLTDIVGVIMAIILPGVGISGSALRIVAALSNVKTSNRFNLATQIAQERHINHNSY